MTYSEKYTHTMDLKKHDLFSLRIAQRNHDFNTKIDQFQNFIHELEKHRELSYFRMISSPMERSVLVSYQGEAKKEVLMFGSNNYLGFANDPYIKEKVKNSIDSQGVGPAGPPLLNGYSKEHHFLEERLAHLKDSEAALIFPSGYQTNLGLIGSLVGRNDRLYIDQLSHASTIDAINLANLGYKKFSHNSPISLLELIQKNQKDGQLFVGIEGLYSMDGDICSLDHIVEVINKNNGICLLDDAHGTGLIGGQGKGVMELFEVPQTETLHIGTFSKSFAVNGGFVAGSKPLINYIRYHARSYLFSASLSYISIAAVHAGLDLIEKEPWRREQIKSLNTHAKEAFREFELVVEPASAIIAIKVPSGVSIRQATNGLFDLGFFVNAVEYPAVKKGSERLRISLMVYHEKEDIEQLADAIAFVFNKYKEA
ncbi:MAG: aminotransferase class I/II-fold pyridoxal phosphate-dependent enzyme [Eudoraea sp.]|uniref:aminotransferase class I/II-fold pyridoxal phosphate-dependent enzyme n=2 Tax=Eudoraea sp. TaxID=1979955 RepID=UPI003C70FB0E